MLSHIFFFFFFLIIYCRILIYIMSVHCQSTFYFATILLKKKYM